jgi:hypothetical protein
MSRRTWGGNTEVHFWWESPVTAFLLIVALAFVVVAI